MSEGARRTEALIRDLGEDLAPVKPIPRLRFALLIVLLAWAGVALVMILPLPDDIGQLLGMFKGAARAIFLALAVGGLGGMVAALGSSVPGRERLTGAGLAIGVLGFAVAAGLGTYHIWMTQHTGAVAPVSGHFKCLVNAVAVAVLPAVGVAWFAGRASPYRPLVVVVAAAAGTAALGSIVIQAVCPFGDPMHLMLGHILAPALGAFLLSFPLLVALQRIASHAAPGGVARSEP